MDMFLLYNLGVGNMGKDSWVVIWEWFLSNILFGCRIVLSGISGVSYYIGIFNMVNWLLVGDYVVVVSCGNFFLIWEFG